MDYDRTYWKDRRIGCGLTQEALAMRLGVTMQAVQKWESGKSAPRKPKLIKMLAVMEEEETKQTSKHLFQSENALEKDYLFMEMVQVWKQMDILMRADLLKTGLVMLAKIGKNIQQRTVDNRVAMKGETKSA